MESSTKKDSRRQSYGRHYNKMDEIINETNTNVLKKIIKRQSVRDNFDLDAIGSLFYNKKV